MIIRQAQPKDLSSIISLHNKSLPSSVCDLTALGIKVLDKYYKAVIKDNLSYIVIAEKNDEIIGFCLITKDSQELFKKSLSRSILQIINTFLLSNKINFIKVLLKKILFKSLITDSGPQLVYIGVSHSCVGQGIGQLLLDHVEKIFRKWNIFEFTLDVEENNFIARNFYKKNDYVVEREYLLCRKRKYLMKKTLQVEYNEH